MSQKTIADAVKWGIYTLKSAGFENDVRLEVELLLAHLLHYTRLQLYSRSEETLTSTQAEEFQTLLQQRKKYLPLAYLLGHREFYGRLFGVSPAVLIPRPETEILVEEAIRLAQANPSESRRILDLGTGSGCIGLSLLAELPDYTGDLLDISEEALQIARHNATKHGVFSRVSWIQSDLFEKLPQVRYTLIVSNPPYIDPAIRASLPPEVRLHEPPGALFSDERGLACSRQILKQSLSFLEPKGTLLLEMGAGQAEELLPFAHECGYDNIRVLNDLAGIKRVLVCEPRNRSRGDR